jgi:hypothetical protein
MSVKESLHASMITWQVLASDRHITWDVIQIHLSRTIGPAQPRTGSIIGSRKIWGGWVSQLP